MASLGTLIRRRVRGRARRAAAHVCTAMLLVASAGPLAAPLGAQQPAAVRGVVTGTVRDAATRQSVIGALVVAEGTTSRAVTDSAGRYRLFGVAPGPQTLRVQRIGFAPGRVSVVVPATGPMERDLELAVVPLRMHDVTVTADPVGRARGELGTASVVGREAIVTQGAASVAGLLELVPGTPLSPPGLDGVQQAPLRGVPVSGAADGSNRGPSAGQLAALGTPVILDGVPLSNNANLQSTGPRGDLSVASSAGGGVDLRRLPAATVERLEVIRGIPSARYGDLTQGVILVETRAGAVRPVATARFDARTVEASTLGGWTLGAPGRQALSGSFDAARTRLAPGLREDAVERLSLQLAHRISFGALAGDVADAIVTAGEPRLVLDSRVDAYRLAQDSPERPSIDTGRVSWTHDRGVRLTERARLRLGARSQVTVNAAVDRTAQDAFTQILLTRGAVPFTDRLTEGRAIGRYIGGPYLAGVRLQGVPWLGYGRLEDETTFEHLAGFAQTVRTGLELRREWNAGPGYQFAIDAPPQTTFNGVQGFDRPRRYDALPPLASSAFYLDDRLTRTLAAGPLRGAVLALQAGLRADVLHEGELLGGVRDVAWQPRLNVQLGPTPWLRLRAGWGQAAKLPTLADLSPALQYFDLINVNWYTNNPAERLAVLTTAIRDPTNPSLGLAVATKAEVGIDLTPDWKGAALQLTLYHDQTRGSIGIHPVPGSLLREHFALADSTLGTGHPPEYVEPASSLDTVPYLLQQPGNNLALLSRGAELTLVLPELGRLRTHIEVLGAMTWSRLDRHDLDFGSIFQSFQLDNRVQRAPYWPGYTRTGQRGIITYRAVHHQPELGLVITATVQQNLAESTHDEAATDSLAFAGYVTRTGALVPVPAAERGSAAYADLRREPRKGIFLAEVGPPNDWLMSLQVSKTIPLDGRLSFNAYNVLDRLGHFPTGLSQGRQYPAIRVGLEASFPLGGAAGHEGGA